jgi:hypothetical protein
VPFLGWDSNCVTLIWVSFLNLVYYSSSFLGDELEFARHLEKKILVGIPSQNLDAKAAFWFVAKTQSFNISSITNSFGPCLDGCNFWHTNDFLITSFS